MFSLRRFLMAGAALLGIATIARADNSAGHLDHVLLISVDGMHEVDLRLWIKGHPKGALAALAKRGTTYSQAKTTAPSDSFPGMIAQATGGTPFSAGVPHLLSAGLQLRRHPGCRDDLCGKPRQEPC